MSLREYQSKAIRSVRGKWRAGTDSVCLVAPTGSGKTRMGEECVADEEPTVWIAHRRELITQTAERLSARFGTQEVGMIMPGEYERPAARIQVATIQTLLARKRKPLAKKIVLDEAHHYAAEEWRRVLGFYKRFLLLGLTATPERKDGEALGDIFGSMVVAANYSQLVADGFLVSARVYRPKMKLGNNLAQDPVQAWAKYSEGSRTFMFCGRVDIAHAYAKKFRSYGVPADVIEATTPKGERDDILARFKRGALTVLCNVNTLTEGVDVPEARTVILARAFGHVGGYLQAVGRMLRPAHGKADAILIDLVGASIRHGLPTDDRDYSLEGTPISGGGGPGGGGTGEFSQEIRGEELQLVSRGSLPARVETKPVKMRIIDHKERRMEFDRLLSIAKQSRIRAGLAAAKYHDKFGEWPPQEWTS